MITSTRAIVIRYVKHRESSIILRAYAEDHGFQSFVINGVRSQKSKKSIGVFQPCNLLELVYYRSPNKEIHRLSDAKIAISTHSFQGDVRKGSMVIFISEILNKVLYADHSANPEMFDFLWTQLTDLSKMERGYESFHLFFLVQLARYLGFGIHSVNEISNAVALANPAHDNFFEELICRDHYQPDDHSGEFRHQALGVLLAYYRYHMDHMTEVKSLKVLHQIFH